MKKVLAVIMSAVFLATGTACDKRTPDSEVNRPVEMPTMVTANTTTVNRPQPKPNTLRNCEDSPRVPCITWDENEWRLVTNYRPYTYLTIFRCPTEDSDNCFYDARKRGNKKGSSFVTVHVNGKQLVYRYGN